MHVLEKGNRIENGIDRTHRGSYNPMAFIALPKYKEHRDICMLRSEKEENIDKR